MHPRSLLVALLLAAIPSFNGTAADAPPQALVDLENAFTLVAEQAFPAVVVITNRQRPHGPDPAQLPPEIRRFFAIPDDATPGEPQIAGKGSGALIRADGFLVTNLHVIDGAETLEVRMHDGRIFDSARHHDEVRVVGIDRETDLAVLQIGGGKLKDLPTLPFADSAKIKVGQFAIAVGAPFDLDYSVSVGHVSQKGRYGVNVNAYENYIQTDASINPGNSGGPLLNLRGEIIGINEFILTGGQASRGNIGIGFAIASNLVRQVAESLTENGTMIRPFLGVAMQPLTDALRRQFHANKLTGGVLINDVTPGDPAEKAGLQPGDIVYKVGDTPVESPHDLQFAVLGFKPGETIPLAILRHGEEKTIKVVARQRGGGPVANLPPTAAENDSLQKWGFSLEETKGGIRVKSVVPGSPAANAALRAGDLILGIDRQPVPDIGTLEQILRHAKNESVLLYVQRSDRRFFVPLSILPPDDL